LFIIGAQKIYAHNFKDKTFQQIESFNSYENPNGINRIFNNKHINIKQLGIFALTGTDKTTIAFPDKTKGNVRIKSYENEHSFAFLCCESIVACIKFNHEGTLLATASEKVIITYLFII